MKLFISQNVSDPIVEYGDITATVSSEDILASGGSVNPTVSASQLITYASGKTRLGNLTITKDPTVSASNLGSTLKDRTKIQTWNVQIVGEGGKSVSKSIDIFQEANEIISRDSYSYSGGTYETVPASGGSSTPTSITIICRATFTSGTVVDSYEEAYNGTFEKSSGDGDVDPITGVVTYATRGESIGDERVTVVHILQSLARSEDSPSFYLQCKQEKNVITTFDISSGSVEYHYDVIPAGGGTVDLSESGSYIYTATFSSGNITNNVFTDIITEYYTVEAHQAFSWGGPSGNFTTLNQSTGSVTATSRTNVIGDISNTTITLTKYCNLVPEEEYTFLGSNPLKTSDIQHNIEVTQKANKLASISIVGSDVASPETIFPIEGGVLYFRCKASYTSTFAETVDTGEEVWSLSGDISASMTVTTDQYNTLVKITAEKNESQDIKEGELLVSYQGLKDFVRLTQNGNSITYSDITISNFTVEDIPATGGSISSGTVKYSQTATSATGESQEITSGGSISYSSAVTAENLLSTIKNRSVVGQLTVTISLNGKTASKTIDVYQAANSIESIVIKSWHNTDPLTNGSAAGLYDTWYEPWATYTSTTSAVIKDSYSGWTSSVDWIHLEAVPNTDINAVAVDVLTRGKEVGEIRSGNLSFSYQNKTASITITQNANRITYKTPEITNPREPMPDALASGSYVMISGAFIQEASYSSGETDYITEGGTWTFEGASGNESNWYVKGENLKTTIKARTKLATVKATVTVNSKSASTTVDIYQEANLVTQMTCDGSFSYPQISATATSATPIRKTPLATIKFTSGSTLSLNSTLDAPAGTTIVGTNPGETSRLYTLSEQKNGFNSIDSVSGVLSAANMERVIGTRTSGTVSCLFAWKLTHNAEYGGSVITGSNTTTAICTQGPNEKVYNDIIFSGGSVNKIPASGGTVSTASGLTASQSIKYTSGITDQGKVTISYNTISAQSKGTTISNESTVGTLVATATGEGNKTATKSFTVYQVGNYVTGLTLSGGSLSYPTINAGSTKSTPTITYPSKTYTFSSGATSSSDPETSYGTISMSKEFTLEKVQNGFTKVDSTTGELTATSYGTTIGPSRRSGTVSLELVYLWTPTTEFNTGGSKSASIEYSDSCLQDGNVVERYNYGAWSISLSANPTSLPASGGTSNVTAVASRSKTPIYSSGATGTAETETAVPTLSKGSTPGFYLTGTIVTADHRGTTEGGQRSVEITATYEGVSKKITITQLENYIDHYNYGSWTMSLSASPTSLPASGGTSEITASCSRSKTPVYDSGSSGGSTTETATPTLSITGSGFSLSGTTVTADNRSNIAGSKRTAVVTASYSGATNKTVTIEQEANTRSYSDITILSASTDKVPASGKTVESGHVSFEQTEFFASGYSQKLTNSSNIEWGVLVVPNLGTTETIEKQVGVIPVQVTLNGKTARKEDVPVIQEANVKSYDTTKEITISNFSYPEAPYAQTTVHPEVTATMPVKYTSGASQDEAIPLSYMSYAYYAGNMGAASLSYASGSVSWPYNTTYNWRTCQVEVTVNFQGKIAKAHTTLEQEAEILRLYFKNESDTQIQIGIGTNASNVVGNNIISINGSQTWTLTTYQKTGLYDWSKMYVFGRVQSGNYPYLIRNEQVSRVWNATLNSAWAIFWGNAYPITELAGSTTTLVRADSGGGIN